MPVARVSMSSQPVNRMIGISPSRASLPSPGTWTVEVTAVQAGQPLVFTFEVPIS